MRCAAMLENVAKDSSKMERRVAEERGAEAVVTCNPWFKQGDSVQYGAVSLARARARVPLAARQVYGLALREALKCYFFNSN
jgi:hypothetical protein